MRQLYGKETFLPQMDDSCCGCTLRTGTYIIGCLFVVNGILNISWGLYTVWGLVTGQNVVANIGEFIVAVAFVENQIVTALVMLDAIILLTGLFQNKAKYLQPFIVMMLFSAIQNVFNLVLAFFLNVRTIGNVTVRTMADVNILTPYIAQISSIICIILNLYCYAVVNSYYIVMKRENPSIA